MAVSEMAREHAPKFVAELSDKDCMDIMRRMEALDFGFISELTMRQNEIAYFYVGMIMERLNYERQ